MRWTNNALYYVVSNIFYFIALFHEVPLVLLSGQHYLYLFHIAVAKGLSWFPIDITYVHELTRTT